MGLDLTEPSASAGKSKGPGLCITEYRHEGIQTPIRRSGRIDVAVVITRQGKHRRRIIFIRHEELGGILVRFPVIVNDVSQMEQKMRSFPALPIGPDLRAHCPGHAPLKLGLPPASRIS